MRNSCCTEAKPLSGQRSLAATSPNTYIQCRLRTCKTHRTCFTPNCSFYIICSLLLFYLCLLTLVCNRFFFFFGLNHKQQVQEPTEEPCPQVHAQAAFVNGHAYRAYGVLRVHKLSSLTGMALSTVTVTVGLLCEGVG